MRTLFRVVAIALITAMTQTGLTPLVAQAAQSHQNCPDTVVLTARGSDQNEEYGEYLGPQTYSEYADASNGFEGPNFTALFHQVEQRHPGTMGNVYVLALDDQEYPAIMQLPPLAQEGEDLGLVDILKRLFGIIQRYPVGDLLHSVLIGFIDSLRTGMDNAPKVVEEYETTTGCKPQYVAAGFSQGALVSMSTEQYLSETGRLKGAITIGNPLQQIPWAMDQAAIQDQMRVDYCLDQDVVCDFSLEAANDALSNKAEVHASYFLTEPTAEDIHVVDAVAKLLNSAE